MYLADLLLLAFDFVCIFRNLLGNMCLFDVFHINVDFPTVPSFTGSSLFLVPLTLSVSLSYEETAIIIWNMFSEHVSFWKPQIACLKMSLQFPPLEEYSCWILICGYFSPAIKEILLLLSGVHRCCREFSCLFKSFSFENNTFSRFHSHDALKIVCLWVPSVFLWCS